MRPRITFANVVSVIALFVALGGTAIATHPGGQNTISTGDIQNGQVRTDDIGNGDVRVADIGQGAVATDEIVNGQVKAPDIGDGEVKAAEIANGQVGTAELAGAAVRTGNVANDNLTGGDIAGNSLKGADIDEGTLDVGDTARAYAWVNRFDCTGTPGTCTPQQSKGISTVTRDATGTYCVTAPGINSAETPAAVTVDWTGTNTPEGNASAMTREGLNCGADGKGFTVVTQRQASITVDAGGGVNNTEASAPAEDANDVGFTIVIP